MVSAQNDLVAIEGNLGPVSLEQSCIHVLASLERGHMEV